MKTRKSKAVSLPLVMTNLTLASWETVTRRMLLISKNKCSPAEYQRMVSEKAAAAMSTGITLMSSFGQASMASLMAPWLRRASANAKRLRKK
jgi:hypothetical protein